MRYSLCASGIKDSAFKICRGGILNSRITNKRPKMSKQESQQATHKIDSCRLRCSPVEEGLAYRAQSSGFHPQHEPGVCLESQHSEGGGRRMGTILSCPVTLRPAWTTWVTASKEKQKTNKQKYSNKKIHMQWFPRREHSMNGKNMEGYLAGLQIQSPIFFGSVLKWP